MFDWTFHEHFTNKNAWWNCRKLVDLGDHPVFDSRGILFSYLFDALHVVAYTSPHEAYKKNDRLYTLFDNQSEQHSYQDIKTIGPRVLYRVCQELSFSSRSLRNFPFEEVSLSACFSSYIVFWPKWIGLDWQGWSKSFESGWKRIPPFLWQTHYPRKQEGRKVQSIKNITLYFTPADLKGKLNISVNHLNFPASFIRNVSKSVSILYFQQFSWKTSRAIHPFRWAVSGQKRSVESSCGGVRTCHREMEATCTTKRGLNFLHFCLTLHNIYTTICFLSQYSKT